jgi:hypothetical protein
MGGAKKAFITKANAANDLEGWGGPGAGQGRSDGINVPNIVEIHVNLRRRSTHGSESREPCTSRADDWAPHCK